MGGSCRGGFSGSSACRSGVPWPIGVVVLTYEFLGGGGAVREPCVEGDSVAENRVAAHEWVFKPLRTRPADILALSNARIHGVGTYDASGTCVLVLADGTRVRAQRAEIVAE